MSQSTTKCSTEISALPVAWMVVIALNQGLHSKAVLLHFESPQAVLKENAQSWHAVLSVPCIAYLILRMAHLIVCVGKWGIIWKYQGWQLHLQMGYDIFQELEAAPSCAFKSFSFTCHAVQKSGFYPWSQRFLTFSQKKSLL